MPSHVKIERQSRLPGCHVFCVYGFPERIHTDQGANIESALLAELLKLTGVTKSHITAYHPMGNEGTDSGLDLCI